MTQFPVSLLPDAHIRFDGDIWIDETHPLHEITHQDVAAYNERSATFDLSRAYDVKRPVFTQPLRDLGKDAIFLELACGRASHSLRLMRDGYSVIVSDVSDGTVRWVSQAVLKLGIEKNRSAFAALDAMHLPFADATISGMFMTASLHHLPDPQGAMKEWRRVLKPGGVLLVGYEPSKWSYIVFSPIWKALKNILRRGQKREVSIADDVTEGFTMDEMRMLAVNAGFTDVEVHAVDFLEKIYEHLIVLVLKLMGKGESEYRPSSSVLRAIDRILAMIPVVRRAAWNYDLTAKVPAIA